ncbi:hypothetical protein OEIGOIKO_05790 [Streptomyces chrestomyceticus JCM 4735]|uniref:Uncharacterized protein n=1 Tax=Streptomyces chrestomyceticus JCM 4735 TaxID=1306181 RepID=A0A7U9KYX8_9ACTN|nr:hypothetical protein [Streptomyces chrestomyceticus]GCD37980.1 hypothetical protein OEIGOIKO_05790 [Streptomyces chrestomyceticus JCM 4735]
MTTLADQQAALDAVAALARAFPGLPAAAVTVTAALTITSGVFPSQVLVEVRHDLGAFERWREALGIDPDGVECRTYEVAYGHSHMSLEARSQFLGADIEVTGYAPALAGQEVAS